MCTNMVFANIARIISNAQRIRTASMVPLVTIALMIVNVIMDSTRLVVNVDQFATTISNVQRIRTAREVSIVTITLMIVNVIMDSTKLVVNVSPFATTVSNAQQIHTASPIVIVMITLMIVIAIMGTTKVDHNVYALQPQHQSTLPLRLQSRHLSMLQFATMISNAQQIRTAFPIVIVMIRSMIATVILGITRVDHNVYALQLQHRSSHQ